MKKFPSLMATATLVVVVVFQISVRAQSNAAVRMITKSSDSSVILRWAPSHPVAWQLGLKYGYIIERYTVTEGAVLRKNDRHLLTTSPILPAEETIWEQSIDKDDYVALAAESIFGGSFEATLESTGLLKIIRKSEELESKFSFCLLAADHSRAAASLSGLLYEDKTVRKGERYLYRVALNADTSLIRMDTAFALASIDDPAFLPEIKDVQVDFEDRRAVITWPADLYSRYYTSYWIEKSADGKEFKTTSETPFLNTFSDEHSPSRFIYEDSIADNETQYYYRVKGVDAFGDIGPTSAIVSGQGRQSFSYAASIVNHVLKEDGSVSLQFSFPEEGRDLVRSFSLHRMEQETSVGVALLSGASAISRSVSDDKPQPSNYYVIKAHDNFGRTTISYPYLVQLPDSLPPAAPAELVGSIDTTGIVQLKWKPNNEPDLMGYAVFRSNFQSEELTRLPGEIRKEPRFTDTLNLSMLTDKVYYTVRAYDNRFNPSGFSTTVCLSPPDMERPVKSLFTNISADSSGIVVAWTKSPSADVVEYRLFRKGINETSWSNIHTHLATDSILTYKDVQLNSSQRYAYTLIAIDKGGLESLPASPVTATYLNAHTYKAISEITYQLLNNERRLLMEWSYDQEGVDHFIIYRRIKGQVPRLVKKIKYPLRVYEDKELPKSSEVEYWVMAVFADGQRSAMSKEILVKTL